MVKNTSKVGRRGRSVREVAAPVAKGMAFSRSPAPTITNITGGVRVAHREFVAELASTGAPFNGGSYAINPGLSALFPWLAPIANRYETYKIRKLTAHYEPQCPATTAGYVMMALEYDAADETPSTASQMLNMNDRAGGPIWSPTRFQANLAAGDKSPSKYTRNGSVTGDIKTYDVGNLYVATQGVTAATVGLVYIEYIIDLFTPQMTASQQQVSGSIIGNGTAAATIFGTPIYYGNIPGTASGKTLTFDQDFEGMIVSAVIGTTMTAAGPSGTCIYQDMYWTPNVAATWAISFALVKALKGQTFVMTGAGATYTGIKMYIADGSYASLFHTTLPLKYKPFGAVAEPVQDVATPSNASSVSPTTGSDILTDSLVEAIASTKNAVAEIKKIRSASSERKH